MTQAKHPSRRRPAPVPQTAMLRRRGRRRRAETWFAWVLWGHAQAFDHVMEPGRKVAVEIGKP
jgi:hypothetical protein